jgi:hypothetical protein
VQSRQMLPAPMRMSGPAEGLLYAASCLIRARNAVRFNGKLGGHHMSHYRQVLLGVVVLLAVQESSRTVCAECISFSPCAAWRQSSIVFVADVIEAGSPWEQVNETTVKPAAQTARFKIVEGFKGVPADRQEITAKIAYSSVETVFVTAGVRYLVYAQERSDGTWNTTCSRTKPVRDANQDLAELPTCRAQ